jgi:thiamine biosynthesis lipoprotein
MQNSPARHAAFGDMQRAHLGSMGVNVWHPQLTVWGLAAVAGLVTGSVPLSPPVWVERETAVMGTHLRVTVAATSRQHGIDAIEAGFREVRRLDSILSSWRSDSELSRINGAPPGHLVEVSSQLVEILAAARRWTDRTRGAFDPGVGALIGAWDLRGQGRRPSDSELRRALAASGLHRFGFDPSSRTVARPSPLSWIDAGAFGKGTALRAVERRLRAAGVRVALLDFGGQVLAMGRPPWGQGWSVGVAHPSARRDASAVLTLRDQSAATTSASERFVSIRGHRVGHVLDPRTGRPVPAWGSVTVVAQDPFVADLLSTAVFAMGPDSGAAFADSLPDIGVLLVRDDADSLSLRWNNAMSTVLADQGWARTPPTTFANR